MPHPKPHRLSLTADFSSLVWLVRGTETRGVWVGDDEDGSYSVFSSWEAPEGIREYETLQSGFTALSEAITFARKCQ